MIILSEHGTSVKVWGEHAKSHDMQKFYQSFPEGRRRLASLPVCPQCEKAGFRTKGWKENKTMHCPHCGYNGPCTHVVSAYLEEKLYK